MIWGIDHLVMSAPPNSGIGAALKPLGFEADFIDVDVPSAPEKTPVLSKPRPLHDIEFYRPVAGGLAVEVIAHGDDLDLTPGPYTPVFNVKVAPAGTINTTLSDALDAEVVSADLGATGVFFSAGKETDPKLTTVALETGNVDQEADFWSRTLGFNKIKHGPGWQLLETSTPVAAWSGQLLLKHSDNATSAPMDGQGFTCLALVSNDIDNDLKTAFTHGGTSYDCRFEISVNERPLIVALFRTPGGALVEFIQNVK